MSESIAMLS